MEDLIDPEEMIMCPYEPSHNIRRARMSFHLVKCRKVHGEQRMVSCDFNTTHMVPEPELRYHHQICSDRKKIEPTIVESQFRSRNRFPIPKLDYGDDESWDNENAPTYNPTAYVENNDIIREMSVESASTRKAFRQNERLRMGAIASTEASSSRAQNEAKAPPKRNTNEEKKDVEFDPEAFRRKLKIGNKVYLQHKGGSDTARRN